MKAKRTAILISGRGSNMRSIVEAAMQPDYPARPALIVSNRPKAAGIAYAEKVGIKTAIVDHKQFDSRDAFEQALNSMLIEHDIELVCLAGFMRLLGADFVDCWRDRMVNIHPSLLPAFKGLDTHERVINAGVKITGCTVHFVRAQMDDGPIIAQAAVPVATDDTPETLAARVLAAEHALYPRALALVATGHVRIHGEVARITADTDRSARLIVPGAANGSAARTNKAQSISTNNEAQEDKG